MTLIHDSKLPAGRSMIRRARLKSRLPLPRRVLRIPRGNDFPGEVRAFKH